ncbi:O-antigen ligase family protein [Serratia sp. 2723]|uniref:O-antigen ligase family protein n=1 Tax=unclassified Serratia (in: enterobacteria) TaxID=2647522 RepID=UPI003D245F58
MNTCLLFLFSVHRRIQRLWSNNMGARGYLTIPIAGSLLLTLPLLWVPGFPLLPWEAWSRVVVLWLAFGMMVLLVRRPAGVFDTADWLAAGVLVAAALAVACVLLWQVHPALTGTRRLLEMVPGGRAKGLFGQPNLTASFLATGVLLCTHLLFTHAGRHPWHLAGTSLLVAVMTAAMTLTFSRTGWLGVWTGLAALSWLAYQRVGWRVLIPGGCVVAGWGGMILLLWLHGGSAREVLSADTPRTQIWHATWALIKTHPWAGIGYGQFAHRFPDGLAMIHQVQIDKAMMPYPHNELLLWWGEGGLVGLAGMVCFMVWGVKLLRNGLRVSAQRGGYGAPGTAGPGWLLCLAPVLVHSLLEYPAYQSPLHLLLLVLLPALALREQGGMTEAAAGTDRDVQPTAPCGAGAHAGPAFSALWGLTRRLLVCGVVVMTLWFCITAMCIEAGRVQVNATGGAEAGFLLSAARLNPWYAPERVGYQEAMHVLYRYNQDRLPADPALDRQLLATAAAYLKRYLAVYPDPNGWKMYLDTLYLMGDTGAGDAALAQARHEVAWDPRFAPGTY